ncbi:hypothetical protein DYI26_11930 [Halomonas litopenaei]|nr:hypothetical protein [Halomonas litopenaei]
MHQELDSPTPQEQATIDDYTSATRPVCIGRFIIDIPERMELAYHTFKVNDATITAEPSSHQRFERFITNRQHELENTRTMDAINEPFLKGVMRDGNTVIFDRNFDESVDDSGRVLEGYKFIQNTRLSVSIDAQDLSAEKDREWRRTITDNKAKRLRQIRYLLDHLDALPPEGIPDSPGACFAHGLLATRATPSIPGAIISTPQEEVVMRFVDRERDDVHLTVTTESDFTEGNTLLDRFGEIENGLSLDPNAAIFRSGEVTLPGIPQAAAWVGRITEDAYDIPTTYAYLEGNSRLGDPLTPFFKIFLYNGEAFDHRAPRDLLRNRASLTDVEAVGMWDAVTRSFRPRPGAY